MQCDFGTGKKIREWLSTYKIDEKHKVERLSLVPLFLETYNQKNKIVSATGFIIKNENDCYLVTNWHVFSNLHPARNTNLSQDGKRPNKIKIYYHSKDVLTEIIDKFEEIRDKDDKPLWIEYPYKIDNEQVDVALLKLSNLTTEELFIMPISFELTDDPMIITTGESLSIIGFPMNISNNNFPIWKTGHVASDIETNDLFFYIDATTKSGMSGSPVIAKRIGDYTPYENDNLLLHGDNLKFLGIYSNRITQDDEDLNIGKVWKLEVIKEILKNGIPAIKNSIVL